MLAVTLSLGDIIVGIIVLGVFTSALVALAAENATEKYKRRQKESDMRREYREAWEAEAKAPQHAEESLDELVGWYNAEPRDKQGVK